MKPRHILLSGTLFYVILAPFFFHPDLKIIYSIATLLFDGVFNVYALYGADPSLFPLGPFVYPPAAYFFTAIFYGLAKVLAAAGFSEWLAMGNTAVQTSGIFSFLFAIKLPFIVLHLITGVLLIKVLAPKDQAIGAALWFFNPIAIYVVSLMGQIDSLAVVWIVLALVLAKNKPLLGAASLGLGAAVKSFPLLLLPVYIILVAKSWRQRIVLSSAGLMSYGIWIVWYLKTPGFYDQAFASGLAKSILSQGVPIVLGVITLFALIKHSGKIDKLTNYFLMLGLVVLSGIHYHPQWAMWILPMAVVYVSRTRQWWWGALLIIAWLCNLFSFTDRFLTFGLLSPLNYSSLYLPSMAISEIFGKILIISCLGVVTYETLRK